MSDTSAFVAALLHAPLLGRCGGPYEGYPLLVPVPWERASELMACTLLDVTPCSNLDRMLVEANRAASGICHSFASASVGSSLLGILRKSRLCRAAAGAVERAVDEASTRWPRRFREDWFVGPYLSCLLAPTASLVALSAIGDWPELIRVVDVVFSGFLPVDVEGEGGQTRISAF